MRDIGKPDVGDIGSAQNQLAQSGVRTQVGHGGIGNELRGVQRELFQLLQLLESLDSAVGNIREGKIEALETVDLDYALDIVVGGPGARERYLDDRAARIADNLAT